MTKKNLFGFEKGEEIRLKFGAIVIPIKRNRQGEINNAELIEYLMSARKRKCEFKEDCIDALANKEYYLGFSCERCPMNKRK